MAKGTWIALGIIVILIVAGIAFYATKEKAMQSCEVSVTDIRLGNIGLTGADVKVVFEIRNLGDTTATMDKIDYKVYGNGTLLGEGEVIKRLDIPPAGVKTADTSFSFKYADVGQAIQTAIREGAMDWEVKGTSYLHTPTGDVKVPLKFAKSAE
jgi:LEA14-like dessication related protein